MAKNRPKDEAAPPSPPADPAPESLLTSQDIFGEILDSFGDAPTASGEATKEERPLPVRKDPIRIRVSEPSVSASVPRKAVEPPSPEAGRILSEEVAALLDAFSEPMADVVAPIAAVVVKAGPPETIPDLLAPPVPEDSETFLRQTLEDVAPPSEDDGRGPSMEEAFQDLLNLRAPKIRLPTEVPTTKVKDAPPPPEPASVLDLASLAEQAMREAKPPPPLPVASAASGLTSGQYGPYGLLERVAVGGMAEVFKAKRSGVEGFEKIVAVKRILPHLSENKEFVDMFINEAKMVAGLTHPNIVQIFDLGRLEKTYYIAMEFIHGRDLRSILRRGKERGLRVPLDLSVHIVGKVCSALEFAHRKKDERGRPMMIVHRDVSPQNILISFEGEVKLTDFGIAKAATKASMTDAGALRGKLLYMSPEQAWGKRMDRRSDVFSLGIVFYEMVTEEKPFLGGSEMSILELVRECRVPPPSTVNPRIPEKLEKVIMKALERDPNHRYQDAFEMYRDLERVLQERRSPTASELARFMEILFDEDERVDMYPGDATPEEFRPAAAISDLDVEFDQSAGGDTLPETPAAPPAKEGKEAISIQKLLKRFGIK